MPCLITEQETTAEYLLRLRCVIYCDGVSKQKVWCWNVCFTLNDQNNELFLNLFHLIFTVNNLQHL